MGIAREEFRLDFFAGTMFWVRREALSPLRKFDLTLSDFSVEKGAVDGQLEHALERIFGAIPQATSMFLDNAPITKFYPKITTS